MKTSQALAERTSVFLPEQERTDAHIVDVLIEERCPSFVSHWSWPMMRPILHSLLGYDRAISMANHIMPLSGADAFEYLAKELAFDMTLNQIERLPKDGRLIIAANHPTGLADGVAVWEAITRVRKDVHFFANADAVRVSEGFIDTIIPVEWVMSKRSAAKTKETLRRAKEAIAKEECIVIFPSGKLANKVNGKLTEKPWFSTVVTLAKKQGCPVLPLNLQAKNSWLYYFLSKVNGELRDITLFYELLNKKRSKFDMTFGPLIQPDELAGDPQGVTNLLQDYVAYDLANAPDTPFTEWRSGQT